MEIISGKKDCIDAPFIPLQEEIKRMVTKFCKENVQDYIKVMNKFNFIVIRSYNIVSRIQNTNRLSYFLWTVIRELLEVEYSQIPPLLYCFNMLIKDIHNTDLLWYFLSNSICRIKWHCENYKSLADVVKDISNVHNIYHRTCILYNYYRGLSISHMTTFFKFYENEEPKKKVCLLKIVDEIKFEESHQFFAIANIVFNNLHWKDVYWCSKIFTCDNDIWTFEQRLDILFLMLQLLTLKTAESIYQRIVGICYENAIFYLEKLMKQFGVSLQEKKIHISKNNDQLKINRILAGLTTSCKKKES